jgi:predicted metal-binding membrane protein
MRRTPLASPTVQRNLVLLLLAAMAATCWAVLLARPWSAGPGMAPGMAMTAPSMGPTMGLPAPAFVAIWSVMMVAMMFPAAAPMILTFHRIQSGKRRRGESFVSTWLFVAGYAAVWATAGLAAYLAAVAAAAIAARLTLSPTAASRIGGALLIAAGLYQLTPLKHVCLSQCRSPIGFIMTSWRDGAAGALRMGLMHGVLCFGCCWLLMVVLFPLGIMNIAAMALIALIVFAEKALAWGRAAVYGTAAMLTIYGALVMAVPRILPTFAASAATNRPAAMPMGAMPMGLGGAAAAPAQR